MTSVSPKVQTLPRFTNFLLVSLIFPFFISACALKSGQTELDNQFLLAEEILIGLLFLAALVGIITQRLRLPYTVGLVLLGLAIAVRNQIGINLIPNLILALLVPPLVFEAAFHLNLSELQRNFTPILTLAVPGVLITTFLVGFIIAKGTGISIYLALICGALVSATDPVSVVALFRTLGIPQRLQVLLEGESLFNDGTAIVVFNLILAGVLSANGQFNLPASLGQFILIAGGGLVIGYLLGYIFSQIISRISDYLIVTALTSVLAYGAFLIANGLGVSGVLAVLAAGLVNGNISPKGMSPTIRIVVFNFWEFAAFLANSFVFLLIGLKINLPALFINWQPILWAIGGVLIARAVTVYLLSRIGGDIPLKWQHTMFWGGLRGAITLALALSLPSTLGENVNLLQSMAFGVVLFSLIVQGLTIGPLIKKLRLVKREEIKTEYERRHARAVASKSAYEYLDRLRRQGLISEHTWLLLSEPLKEHNQALINSVRDGMSSDPVFQKEDINSARLEYLRAQRSAFAALLKDGVISDKSYAQLVTEVDTAMSTSDSFWPELIIHSSERGKMINCLIIAVVQDQDVENASSSLSKEGFSITRLPSSGGFLGRRNATLLIGLAHGQEEKVTKILFQSCRTRVEFVTLPVEGSPIPVPTPTPISVGGATIFTFDVDRFEEF
jgi:Na+:H+ antiporter